MTTTVLTLARLGLALSGTNADLEVLPSDKSNSGQGDGEESEEDSSEGSGQGDGEEEDGESGSESGDNAESDGEEEGEAGGNAESDGDDSGDSEGSGQGGEGEKEDGESGSDSGDNAEGDSEDGDSEDGDSEDGDKAEGDSAPSDDPDDGQESGDSDKDADSPEGTPGGTGAGTEQAEIARDVLDAIESGEETGLADNNSALGDALKGETDKDADDCERNEQVWRPYDSTLDAVRVVPKGKPDTARDLQSRVKREISFLRSKLRAKFLQARAPQHIHGVRKGRELSERRLVNSVVELRSNQRPTRPDWRIETKPECTLAAAVVIDESGSMSRLRERAAMAALAIATPLDELGSPCMVCGPRNNRAAYGSGGYGDEDAHTDKGKARFHRYDGITIDVFKDWDEPMRRALPRFPNVKATGGTPLSDGIQYALQSLSQRPERHRVVLVITDGHPANSNVVRRQIRIAAEQGVTVVGVGISGGCRAVPKLFPVHVAVKNLAELPREVLGILDSIMFPKVGGKKLNLDGKMDMRKSR